MDTNCTATGQALANRLSFLVGALLDNKVPPCVGHPITALLDQLDAKQRRQAAISGAVAILSEGLSLSRNQKARRLAAALLRHQRRYRRVVWQQIDATALDHHLQTITQTGGTGWRTLFDEIAVTPAKKPGG
jgi:hypothetical protein